MRIVVLIALLHLYDCKQNNVFHPRSVNVALETVLEFNNYDNTDDMKIIDKVTGFLDRLRSIIDNGKSGRRSLHGDNAINFIDFVKNLIYVLIEYSDDDLDDIMAVINNEFRRYHYKGCKFYELIENYNLRRYFAGKWEEFKEIPPKDVRKTLKSILKVIEDETFDDNQKKMIDYVNSLYVAESAPKFWKLLQNLALYTAKSKRSNLDLVKIVRDGLRSVVFDHYSAMDIKTRRDLKMRVETFWKDYSNPLVTKRYVWQFQPFNKNKKDIIKEEGEISSESLELKIPEKNKRTKAPHLKPKLDEKFVDATLRYDVVKSIDVGKHSTSRKEKLTFITLYPEAFTLAKRKHRTTKTLVDELMNKSKGRKQKHTKKITKKVRFNDEKTDGSRMDNVKDDEEEIKKEKMKKVLTKKHKIKKHRGEIKKSLTEMEDIRDNDAKIHQKKNKMHDKGDTKSPDRKNKIGRQGKMRPEPSDEETTEEKVAKKKKIRKIKKHSKTVYMDSETSEDDNTNDRNKRNKHDIKKKVLSRQDKERIDEEKTMVRHDRKTKHATRETVKESADEEASEENFRKKVIGMHEHKKKPIYQDASVVNSDGKKQAHKKDIMKSKFVKHDVIAKEMSEKASRENDKTKFKENLEVIKVRHDKKANMKHLVGVELSAENKTLNLNKNTVKKVRVVKHDSMKQPVDETSTEKVSTEKVVQMNKFGRYSSQTDIEEAIDKETSKDEIDRDNIELKHVRKETYDKQKPIRKPIDVEESVEKTKKIVITKRPHKERQIDGEDHRQELVNEDVSKYANHRPEIVNEDVSKYANHRPKLLGKHVIKKVLLPHQHKIKNIDNEEPSIEKKDRNKLKTNSDKEIYKKNDDKPRNKETGLKKMMAEHEELEEMANEAEEKAERISYIPHIENKMEITEKTILRNKASSVRTSYVSAEAKKHERYIDLTDKDVLDNARSHRMRRGRKTRKFLKVGPEDPSQGEDESPVKAKLDYRKSYSNTPPALPLTSTDAINVNDKEKLDGIQEGNVKPNYIEIPTYGKLDFWEGTTNDDNTTAPDVAESATTKLVTTSTLHSTTTVATTTTPPEMTTRTTAIMITKSVNTVNITIPFRGRSMINETKSTANKTTTQSHFDMLVKHYFPERKFLENSKNFTHEIADRTILDVNDIYNNSAVDDDLNDIGAGFEPLDKQANITAHIQDLELYLNETKDSPDDRNYIVRKRMHDELKTILAEDPEDHENMENGTIKSVSEFDARSLLHDADPAAFIDDMEPLK